MAVDVPPLCRRHLALLACIIKSARANMPDPLVADRWTAQWVTTLSRGNKSFDTERFLKCCGVPPVKK